MTGVFSLILLLGTGLELRAQASVFDEYQLKAAFLYNFAKFVEWPSDSFATPSEPMGICVVGQNPFGSALENMVQGKKIGDRSFAVRRMPDAQRANKCQIVFIAASEGKRTRAILEALRRADILTVGETEDFTAQGGVIGFKLDGPRVRIQIALETAVQHRLRISSKLLSLAEIVKRQP